MSTKTIASLQSGDRVVGMASPALNPISRRWEDRINGQTVLGVVALPYGYTRVYLVGDPLPMTYHSSHKVTVDNRTLHYSES